jgi:hypothetical protein
MYKSPLVSLAAFEEKMVIGDFTILVVGLSATATRLKEKVY